MEPDRQSRDAAATYLVECFAPGVTGADVMAAAQRVRAAAAGLHRSGTPVEYIGALLMPIDEVVFHMFRSADGEAVREASSRAALGFERVLETVLFLGSEEGEAGPEGAPLVNTGPAWDADSDVRGEEFR